MLNTKPEDTARQANSLRKELACLKDMKMKKIIINVIATNLVVFILLSNLSLKGNSLAYQRSCDIITNEGYDNGNCYTTVTGFICQVGYESAYCTGYVTVCEGGVLSGGWECSPLCTP